MKLVSDHSTLIGEVDVKQIKQNLEDTDKSKD
jgi:hypothetical protein